MKTNYWDEKNSYDMVIEDILEEKSKRLSKKKGLVSEDIYWEKKKTFTVWFFSTATTDEDITQKLEELAIFWKKPLKDESLQFFCWKKSRIFWKTRPDTRQDSRGWLGRSGNAKTACNSINPRDGRTNRPTRQGVESRIRD